MMEYHDRDVFRESLRGGQKLACPCCGRWAQVYRRTIHATLAAQLIALYKIGAYSGRYVHANAIYEEMRKRKISAAYVGRDFCIVKYWGLAETRNPDSGQDSRTSGYWTLTPKGLGFVMQTLSVPKYADVFDDKVLALHGAEVSIVDCLKKKFSYSELMNGG